MRSAPSSSWPMAMASSWVASSAAAWGMASMVPLPVRALRRFLGAQGPNWATIIAWNLFFAFFPIVILAITAVGLVLHDPGARATIEQQIFAAFPSCRAQQSGGGGGCQIISVLND